MLPVISFVGKSNSGKTTVVEKLVPVLKRRGYRLGVIKHALHGFEIDQKGKDSFRHKAAGADAVVVASKTQVAVVRDSKEEALDSLLRYVNDMDLVITEGFKKERHPKIEVLRAARGGPLLCADDDTLTAVVTDLAVSLKVPVFGLDQIEALADFIETEILGRGKSRRTEKPDDRGWRTEDRKKTDVGCRMSDVGKGPRFED